VRWRLAARAGAVCLYAGLGWIIGLGCLAIGVFRVMRFLVRLAAALRPTLRCPDGHETPVYARWRCRDHVYDGWCFRCPVCGPAGWAGHVSCVQCGLAISSPLVRE
jgi:hypothetical protein